MTAVRASPERTNARQCCAAGPSAGSGMYVAVSPKASGRRARSPRAARVTAAFSPDVVPDSSGGKLTARRLSGSTSARYSASVPW